MAPPQLAHSLPSQLPSFEAIGNVLKRSIPSNLKKCAKHPPMRGFTATGVGLIAMVVGDAGIASSVPEMWNAGPLGCILIGLQPRGCWQILQRGVQWGNDWCSDIFGVACTPAILYGYFTTSIRNRIEVWDSPRWDSPMRDNRPAEAGWERFPHCSIGRPTKLVEGSRGGQAFMAEILQPGEGKNLSLVAQARMQLISLLLVAAALMHQQDEETVRAALEEDFGVGEGLGKTFTRLYVGLICACVVLFGALALVAYDLFACAVLGNAAGYIIKLAAMSSCSIGGVGILMLGGNPRVRLFENEALVNATIREKIAALPTDPESGEDDVVELVFGTSQGSNFTPHPMDRCYLPRELVVKICSWDIMAVRTRGWYMGMGWGFVMLAVGIALQLVDFVGATVGPEMLNLGLLLATALLRGMGLSGPEEWHIPSWKMRPGTHYGAVLVGHPKAI